MQSKTHGDVHMKQEKKELYLVDIFRNKGLIFELAINDMKARFAAASLGVVWAYVQPLVSIMVFWAVFEIGFKTPPVSGAPFIIWFAPSFFAWNFFSDAAISGTNCFLEYSYLVKKVNFDISIVPIVKIFSSAFVHISFIAFSFLLLFIYRMPFCIYNIQVIYYFICMLAFLIGMCLIFSSISPFLKDMSYVVSVFIQIGFWTVPIFWSADNMVPVVRKILMINPMFYICQGYRDAFVDHIWFWERGMIGIWFWIVTILLFMYGVYLFNKLRQQFVDVL